MLSAEYRGNAHPELIGKRAQIRRVENDPETVLVQFDEFLVSKTISETRTELLHPGLEPSEAGRFQGRIWYLGWSELPTVSFHRWESS